MPLASRLLGVKEVEIVRLDRKVQRTLEREMDTLLKYVNPHGHVSLLNLEWQVANEPKMARRMLLYHALANMVYDLPVIGVVFYIGKEKLNMPSGIDEDNLKFAFRIVDFATFNPSTFLESNIPDEVIMALLAGQPDFKQKREIIRKTLHKLQLLLCHDPGELGRRLAQFEIIGKLRDAQKIIIEEENIMALTYNIETDIRYNQGLGVGLEKGRIAFATYLLQNTSHSVEEIAKLVKASVQFVTDVKTTLNLNK